jgi:hypothetical protein
MTMMILSPRAQEIAEEIMASFERISGLVQQLSPGVESDVEPDDESDVQADVESHGQAGVQPQVQPDIQLDGECDVQSDVQSEVQADLQPSFPEESLPHGIKRDLRMSGDDIRRINGRTRDEATRLPPDLAWLVNAKVDQIEMDVALQEYRLSVSNRAQALYQEFVAVLIGGIADFEAYAVEVFYALKRASRQPGREHLIPQVQQLQRALRRLRAKKRTHPK